MSSSKDDPTGFTSEQVEAILASLKRLKEDASAAEFSEKTKENRGTEGAEVAINDDELGDVVDGSKYEGLGNTSYSLENAVAGECGKALFEDVDLVAMEQICDKNIVSEAINNDIDEDSISVYDEPISEDINAVKMSKAINVDENFRDVENPNTHDTNDVYRNAVVECNSKVLMKGDATDALVEDNVSEVVDEDNISKTVAENSFLSEDSYCEMLQLSETDSETDSADEGHTDIVSKEAANDTVSGPTKVSEMTIGAVNEDVKEIVVVQNICDRDKFTKSGNKHIDNVPNINSVSPLTANLSTLQAKLEHQDDLQSHGNIKSGVEKECKRIDLQLACESGSDELCDDEEALLETCKLVTGDYKPTNSRTNYRKGKLTLKRSFSHVKDAGQPQAKKAKVEQKNVILTTTKNNALQIDMGIPEIVDLASEDDDNQPTASDVVCSSCHRLWNDALLLSLFKGEKPVAVKSRITYGSVVLMFRYAACTSNDADMADKAVHSLLKRAGLAHNLSGIGIKDLVVRFENMIWTGSLKCCGVALLLYSKKAGMKTTAGKNPLSILRSELQSAKRVSQDQAMVADTSRKLLPMPENLAIPDSFTTVESQLENILPDHNRIKIVTNVLDSATPASVSKKIKVSTPSSEPTDVCDNIGSHTSADKCSLPFKITSVVSLSTLNSDVDMAQSNVTDASQRNIALNTTVSNVTDTSILLQAAIMKRFDYKEINADIIRKAEEKQLPGFKIKLFQVLCQERAELPEFARATYDLIPAEYSNFQDNISPDVSNRNWRFVTVREMLFLQHICILGNAVPDVDFFFRVVFHIFQVRGFILLVPDGPSLLLIVEEYRKRMNRIRGKNVQMDFFLKMWDYKGMHSSPNVQLHHNEHFLDKGLKVAHILTVFCLWRRDEVRDPSSIKLALEKLKFDCKLDPNIVTTCVNLYILYCDIIANPILKLHCSLFLDILFTGSSCLMTNDELIEVMKRSKDLELTPDQTQQGNTTVDQLKIRNHISSLDKQLQDLVNENAIASNRVNALKVKKSQSINRLKSTELQQTARQMCDCIAAIHKTKLQKQTQNYSSDSAECSESMKDLIIALLKKNIQAANIRQVIMSIMKNIIGKEYLVIPSSEWICNFAYEYRQSAGLL